MTLDQLVPGEKAVITKVGGQGTLRLRFLDMGLIPRTAISMEKIAPMGDPLEIRVRGYELTLRAEDARNIEVEKNDGKDVQASGNTKKSGLIVNGGEN